VKTDELLASAVEATGLDDFGDDELFGGDLWRDGLRVLTESLDEEAALNDLGAVMVPGELAGYLANRLRIVAHHRAHPEIRERDVAPPVVIMGQARTGTTMLFDVLAQDPDHRVPLTWEVDAPLPPPRTETYDTDPRIAEADATFEMVDLVIPEFRAQHQLGARLAQEDVRITGATFASAIFPTQYRVPGYHAWLLGDAHTGGHLAASYTWHRRFLELLQSEHPGTRWVVKTPFHVWTLPELMAEYPTALLVQTHRDPARVLASTTSLVATLRRLSTDDIDPAQIAEEFSPLILDGLERTVTAREDGTVPQDQVVDVPFGPLMRDPIAGVRTIYDAFGLELTEGTEQAMATFLRENPREAGGHDYTFADTGLDLAAVRERTARYTERFAVPEEPC
jgi:hypothetical protein